MALAVVFMVSLMISAVGSAADNDNVGRSQPNPPAGLMIVGKPLPVVKIDWGAEHGKLRKCFGKRLSGENDRCRRYDFNCDKVVDSVDEAILRRLMKKK
jgi:hypothetical protein